MKSVQVIDLALIKIKINNKKFQDLKKQLEKIEHVIYRQRIDLTKSEHQKFKISSEIEKLEKDIIKNM